MRVLAAALALLLAALLPGSAAAQEEGWAALRAGGTVALIRHARAPGTGDPPGFRLEECATQRNLSAQGREEARRLGQAFAERGVPTERVLSSRWCRALETARLAFGDLARPEPALDSFFGDREDEPEQTAAVRRVISEWRDRSGVLVMVTHQVNITALTGVFPAEGEILVVRPAGAGGFALVGRIRTPAAT